MASETTFLIQRKNIKLTDHLKKSYSKLCFHSKSGLLTLIFTAVTIMAAQMMIESTDFLLLDSEQHVILYCLIGGLYIFFPVLGYLGERFYRYKVIKADEILVLISYSINFVSLILLITFNQNNDKFQYYIYISYALCLTLSLCGYGLHIANIIQFGASQLQFASSDDFAAFARWCIFTFLVSSSVVDLTRATLSTYPPLMAHQVLLSINAFALFLMIIVVVTSYKLKHLLIFVPPPHIDGIKLIWRVMRFAWKYKKPLQPSAFTYCDGPPSRLDLAKERYGGPYTTVQVEDVKSFWYLILIPLCHYLNPFYSSSIVLGYYYSKCIIDEKANKQGMAVNIVVNFSSAVSNVIAMIGLLIIQLLIVPFFSRYIPNLLRRMWIRLSFILLSSVSVTVISVNIAKSLPNTNHTNDAYQLCCDNIWPYYVLIIPEVLTGIGILISLASQAEFILAQAPCTMQGILIGAMFGQYTFPYLNNSIGIFTGVGKYWQYYASLTCLHIAILIAFTIIIRCYKYRQCNEKSDINVRATIEDIYERDLNAREQ